MPIIINLVGPPGAGKSTGAAYLFYCIYNKFAMVILKSLLWHS